jgi:MoaA/NifB/PqqE/SkfB family radical SAM enzyme
MRDDRPIKGKEWSNKSKYNSFNSYKGLVWNDLYKQIADWYKGNTNQLPPPIELSLDPSHACNFKCGHCNAQRYLELEEKDIEGNSDQLYAKGSIVGTKMTKDHLKNIIDFCADWGVRGVCIGGGGEPLTNRSIWTLPEYIANKQVTVPRVVSKYDTEKRKRIYEVVKDKQQMQSSFATNGSLIDEEMAEQMMNCRWVGVSLDSGSPEVFAKVHFPGYEKQGEKMFDRVINNLELLVKTKEKTGSNIDIALKFLIRPDNWQDIYKACEIARNVGVKDFHARPADLERKDYKNAMEANYHIEEIQDLFAKCHDLEKGDDFRVFTVMHKYNPDFRVEHTFDNCISSPLMLQACSDGEVYVCADHRIEDRFKLCSHSPDPYEILDFWGTSKHREILKGINVDKECARCTYGEYARQIEEIVMGSKGEDPMCVDFP